MDQQISYLGLTLFQTIDNWLVELIVKEHAYMHVAEEHAKRCDDLIFAFLSLPK